jgi:hypothetical protein
VHEKAMMTALIPLTGLAVADAATGGGGCVAGFAHAHDHQQLYLMAVTFGHLGLLPLLFRPTETAFKLSSYAAFLCLATVLLDYLSSSVSSNNNKHIMVVVVRTTTVKKEDNSSNDNITSTGTSMTRVVEKDNDTPRSKSPSPSPSRSARVWFRSLLYTAIGLLVCVTELLFPLFLKEHPTIRLEFLPLMLTSLTCAVGLLGCWIYSGLQLLLYNQ